MAFSTLTHEQAAGTLPRRAEYHTHAKQLAHMSDRKLMETFCLVHDIALMSSGFVLICAELGKRHYDPNYSTIKQQLS